MTEMGLTNKGSNLSASCNHQCSVLIVSLIPRTEKEEKGPGLSRLCMHLIICNLSTC